jgi:hypothetical protein
MLLVCDGCITALSIVTLGKRSRMHGFLHKARFICYHSTLKQVNACQAACETRAWLAFVYENTLFHRALLSLLE